MKGAEHSYPKDGLLYANKSSPEWNSGKDRTLDGVAGEKSLLPPRLLSFSICSKTRPRQQLLIQPGSSSHDLWPPSATSMADVHQRLQLCDAVSFQLFQLPLPSHFLQDKSKMDFRSLHPPPAVCRNKLTMQDGSAWDVNTMQRLVTTKRRSLPALLFF